MLFSFSSKFLQVLSLSNDSRLLIIEQSPLKSNFYRSSVLCLMILLSTMIHSIGDTQSEIKSISLFNFRFMRLFSVVSTIDNDHSFFHMSIRHVLQHTCYTHSISEFVMNISHNMLGSCIFNNFEDCCNNQFYDSMCFRKIEK